MLDEQAQVRGEAGEAEGPVRHDMRTLPLGLRRYRPGVFSKMHAPGAGLISASGVPALFDQSRFHSRFSYLAHVSGRAPADEPDEAIVERGRRLERTVAEDVAEDRGWRVERIAAYAAHPRLGGFFASPDALAWRPDKPGPGLGEIKVVADLIFQRDWLSGVPLEVELQHQAQLACCPAAEWGFIACQVVGSFKWELVIYDAEPHRETIAIIEEQVGADLAMLARGELPSPDASAHAERVLRALYPAVDPGKEVSLQDPEAVARWDRWQQARTDRLAAEKTEEAQRRWFMAQAPDAGLIRVGNSKLVKVKSIPVKERVLPACTQRRITLVDTSADGGMGSMEEAA